MDAHKHARTCAHKCTHTRAHAYTNADLELCITVIPCKLDGDNVAVIRVVQILPNPTAMPTQLSSQSPCQHSLTLNCRHYCGANTPFNYRHYCSADTTFSRQHYCGADTTFNCRHYCGANTTLSPALVSKLATSVTWCQHCFATTLLWAKTTLEQHCSGKHYFEPALAWANTTCLPDHPR